MKYLPLIILLIAIGIYLGVKAIPENSWDGWSVASAQTLLSIKHWSEDGLLNNYLLLLPQGYSKTVRYLDDPELRQHARGITTGGFIGKRLYYTHYPSGYLLFPALLMRLGLENRFWFRFFEILLSLSGLAILYLIFTMVSGRAIAFFGILFYGISTLFLDYADIISNQPIDEFLRLIVILTSIITLKNPKKYLNYLIWIFYFFSFMVSYDSAVFLLAWLIGTDLLFRRKFNWQLWLFWASAPALGFVLQVAQNTIYLGLHSMILDFLGTLKVQMVGSRRGFFTSHFKRLIEPFGWFFGVKWYLGILIPVLGIAAIKFIKKYLPDETTDMRFLYLSFAAILFHFLLFPSLFFYQGRIIAIFGGLLVGVLTTILIKAAPAFFKTNASIQRCIVVFIIFTLILGPWFIQGKRTYDYIKQWPNNVWPQEKIDFDKKIKNLVSGDKVIFQMLGPEQEISGSDRYPMTASEDEYYIGSPILGFTNTSDLVRDFNYLKKRSEFPFSAIIIADKKEVIDTIIKNLKTKRLASQINSRYILIIPK